MVLLRHQLSQDLERFGSQFRWVVLVRGAALEIDEVGRFLKHLEGADDVRFVSSENMLEKLRNDPMLAPDLDFVDAAAFPASWEVRWDIEKMKVNEQRDLAREAKKMASVVDVAFDEATLEFLNKLKRLWFRVDLMFAGGALLGSVFLFFLAGKFFFFNPLKLLDPALLLAAVGNSALWWAVGYVALGMSFGFLPWPAAMGGFFVGLVHYVWIRSFP